jgi:hypothetical protein
MWETHIPSHQSKQPNLSYFFSSAINMFIKGQMEFAIISFSVARKFSYDYFMLYKDVTSAAVIALLNT